MRSDRKSAGVLPLAGIVPLATLLALRAPSPAAAQDGPVSLRLDPESAGSATYRYEQEIHLRMPAEFGGARDISSRLLLRQTPRGVGEDTLRYLAEVREIAVDAGGDGPASPDVSRYRGRSYEMRMTRRGELLSLRPVESGGSGATQLEESLRQFGFPLLPRRPVRVGDRWTHTRRVDATAMALPARGKIVAVNRATLRGLERRGGRTIARFRVESTYRFEPDPRAAPGMRVELTGTRTDDVRFDVTGGRFLDADGRHEFTVRLSIPGAPGSFTIRGDAERKAALAGS